MEEKKRKKAPQRDTEWENSPCCRGDLKESSCCCLPALTLGALRGAEDSVRSLCSPLQSVPFYRQFLSCIDVASHYCRVPINPAFIRPRLLIHFFLSPLTSLTQSGHCSLIPIFSPLPFLLLLSEGNVMLYLCRESVSSAEGEADTPREGGDRVPVTPVSWGFRWNICLNVSTALMAQQIGLKWREWFAFWLLRSHHSQTDSAIDCRADSDDGLRVSLWTSAFVRNCFLLCGLMLIWCRMHTGTYLEMLNRWEISLNDLLCLCVRACVCKEVWVWC